MRVTQNYSIQRLLHQINRSRERISTLQRDLATGKQINQISDAPDKIETVLRYRTMLKFNHRFEENIENALDFMHFSSKTLDDAANILATVKQLAVQGADSTSEDEFDAFVKQLDELLQEMVNLGNSKFKNRYIFGGTNVVTAPFTLAPDGSQVIENPDGIDGRLQVELGQGKIDRYNVTGEEAFKKNVDVFQTLVDLRDAFKNRDIAAIHGLIDQVDQAMDQVLQSNASLGAKINRYELLLDQYRSEDVRLEAFLSSVEDTDMPRAITDLNKEQTVLETALKVLAQTVNISLVDFIR